MTKPSGGQTLALRISARQRAASGGDDQAEPGGRQFGRLRSSMAAPPKTVLDGRPTLRVPVPPATLASVEPPEAVVLPIDSTKTFVGPNGTYYDERWRWMEWRGRNHSWNWSAALTFGGWLAYRRLYGPAAAYLAWIGVLTLMLLHDVSLNLAALVQLGIAITVGVYGNRLYQARFRRAAWQVAQLRLDHAARLVALARQGGVDPRAVWVMVLAAVGFAGLLVGLDG